MGASSRASNGAPAQGLPGPSSDAKDRRIPQKSSGDVLFSPRGSFFADSQGNTEAGFRDRAGLCGNMGGSEMANYTVDLWLKESLGELIQILR